jgi:hypothetical protein
MRLAFFYFAICSVALVTACSGGQSHDGGGGIRAILGYLLIIAVAFVVLAAFGALASASSVAMNLPRQRERENRAQRLVECLRGGNVAERYCLYLRSFDTDSVPYIPNSPGGGPPLTYRSLDETITTALEQNYGLVVCVGNKGFTAGAARIESADDTWRSDVDLLLKNATLIVIIPWHTQGVLEEFMLLMGSASHKRRALFLIPPGAGETGWRLTRSKLKHLGYKVPEYVECGALFSAYGHIGAFHELYSPDDLEDLLRESPRQLLHQVHRVDA